MTASVPHKALAAAQKGKWPQDERLITARNTRRICGEVSDMTLWRWLNDTELNFPRPIYIGRRRYWRGADVSAWLDAQAKAEAA